MIDLEYSRETNAGCQSRGGNQTWHPELVSLFLSNRKYSQK